MDVILFGLVVIQRMYHCRDFVCLELCDLSMLPSETDSDASTLAAPRP